MKQMVLAMIMLISSIFMFAAVVYAWFTLTNESNVQPVNFEITDGFTFDYEIKYYTKDYIYKYDQDTQSVLVYDSSSSSWISPMNLPGGPVYLIEGVFISQYDVLIPENNQNNNLIVEISVIFTNDVPMLVSQKLVADSSISSQIVSSLNLETSRAYYVSEVSNIQTFLSDSYNAYGETFNKYEILNTEFNLRDGSNNFIYPPYSFYQNDIYQTTIEMGDSVIQPDSTRHFFYNFTYDDLRVNAFFDQEFQSSVYDVTSIPLILFLQDIQMVISEGGNYEN